MWVYLVCMKWWSSQHVKQLIPDSQCSPLRVYLICVCSRLCFISFVSQKFVDQKCWFSFLFIFPCAPEDFWFNVNGTSSLTGENKGKLWVDLSLRWIVLVKQAWVFNVNSWFLDAWLSIPKRGLILITGAPKFGPSELAFIFEDSIIPNSCMN